MIFVPSGTLTLAATKSCSAQDIVLIECLPRPTPTHSDNLVEVIHWKDKVVRLAHSLDVLVRGFIRPFCSIDKKNTFSVA